MFVKRFDLGYLNEVCVIPLFPFVQVVRKLEEILLIKKKTTAYNRQIGKHRKERKEWSLETG